MFISISIDDETTKDVAADIVSSRVKRRSTYHAGSPGRSLRASPRRWELAVRSPPAALLLPHPREFRRGVKGIVGRKVGAS